MTFKSHLGSALYVQDDAIAVIECGSDPFRVGFPGQSEKVPAVQPVEPGQAVAHLVGMYPTTGIRITSPSRDKIGVRGNRKSASAATLARSCCQSAGSQLLTSNAVQLKLSGTLNASKWYLVAAWFPVCLTEGGYVTVTPTMLPAFWCGQHR